MASPAMSDEDLRDRFRGCLMGLAVCDALGTTLEFKPPGAFARHTDITGGGPFKLKPGQYTDDTSMALCMAASLTEKQRYEPEDQMRRYKDWYAHGYMSSTGACFDIGNTTRAALSRYHGVGSAYCGDSDLNSAGNGCIMRLCPVVLAFSGVPELAMELAADSSATTHAVLPCLDSCRYMAAVILAALRGTPPHDAPPAASALFADYWRRRPIGDAPLAAVVAGSYRSQAAPPKSTGYVVQTMLCALWALHTTASFRDGAIAVVNLGGDADTAGAVFGQVAGAAYGLRGVPEEWVRKVQDRELILRLADDLFDLSRPARLVRAVSDLRQRRLFVPHQLDLAQVEAQLVAASAPGH